MTRKNMTTKQYNDLAFFVGDDKAPIRFAKGASTSALVGRYYDSINAGATHAQAVNFCHRAAANDAEAAEKNLLVVSHRTVDFKNINWKDFS